MVIMTQEKVNMTGLLNLSSYLQGNTLVTLTQSWLLVSTEIVIRPYGTFGNNF